MLGDHHEQYSSNRKRRYVLLGGVTILALAALIAVYSYSPKPQASLVSQVPLELHHQEFLSYLKKYEKNYSPEEYTQRFQVYLDNTRYIRAFNNLGKDWKLGVNSFTDLTPEEFRAKYLRKMPVPEARLDTLLSENIEIPSSVDWREKGAVSSVKNQGACGSCWSFSAAGSIEGAWAISGNGLKSLSEQQLIDCSREFGNNGCNGGLMDDAFKYVMQYGLTSENNYPYVAKQQGCNRSKVKDPVAKISSYQDVPGNNPTALKMAIAQQPVAVAVEADTSIWQSYAGGVVTGDSCGTSLDHGVLAVGYGVSSSPYYIVKNSWGGSWGLSGYIYIGISGGEGICGIQRMASYPIV